MSLQEKYDIEKKWEEPCRGCGQPVVMTSARYEVLGVYHTGCFGHPACSCREPHKGECKAMSDEKAAPQEDSATRFITVGTRILEIGQKLKAKRAERDALSVEISKMEQEIGPLMVEHQSLMAGLVGMPAIPTGPIKRQAGQPSPATAPEDEPDVLNTPIGPVPNQVRARVINALQEADLEEGPVSATDIASQLNIPADWARAVMANLKQSKPRRPA